VSENFPDIHVIILKIDDTGIPELDLGTVPPHAAYTFLQQAADCLLELIQPPRVIFEGQTIFDYNPAKEED